MRASAVLTLTGPDRVGIVEEVSRELLRVGANVEASRMARLGGEFAMLVLLSLPAESLDSLADASAVLRDRGYKVTTSVTGPEDVSSHPGWLTYRIDVEGADHEGIVHEIAAGLAMKGITIESAETSTQMAPLSGSPLFCMSAVVAAAPGLDEVAWIAALKEAARLANVDVRVTKN
jgi:glycine cleavage system transcriptional repressor